MKPTPSSRSLPLATLLLAVPAAVFADITVVAVNGERSPDNSGDLAELSAPVMQSPGKAVYSVVIRENGFLQKHILARSGPLSNNTVLLVSENVPSPDGDGNIGSLAGLIPFTNSAGEAAFDNRLENTLGASRDAVFATTGGNNSLRKVVRSNELVPGSSTDRFGDNFTLIGFSDSGHAGFHSQTLSGVRGIWREIAPGNIVRVVGSGDSRPGGSGVFALASNNDAIMNNAGQVVFSDFYPQGSLVVSSIYRGLQFNSLDQIVTSGDPAPNNDGAFAFSLHPISINDHGDVAFVSTLSGTPLGDTDNQGLYMREGATIFELARKRSLAPDANGRYLNLALTKKIILNNRKEVLFRATISGATPGAAEGVFLASKTRVEQVARLGAPAPGGGTFKTFNDMLALNNSGEAAFFATVDMGQFNSSSGIFIYKSGQLTTVARLGDSVPGIGSITGFSQISDMGNRQGQSMLDDTGRVTFAFFYTGGNSAIGVWQSISAIFANGFE